MLLQCWILVLNDAKASHTEVHACCALQRFFKSAFSVMFKCAGLPYMGIQTRAHSALQVPPPLCLDTTL